MRVKRSNNASPSPHRIARCRDERSSENRPSISSTASRLFRKTSRHIVGSDAAIRVKSRKPPAENLITSDLVTVLQVSRRTDNIVSNEVRYMAGDGKNQIVMHGIHDLEFGAKRRDESAKLVDGLQR